MATFDNSFWQLLATFGNFWQLMATYGNFATLRCIQFVHSRSFCVRRGPCLISVAKLKFLHSYYGAAYCYGSRGQDTVLTQRLDDPPGIPSYIPCRSPLHKDEEWGQGWNTATDDDHLTGQNRNIFDSKIIWLLAEPIGQ